MKTVSAFPLIALVLCLAYSSFALDNIALGKAYTLEPAPGYTHCTDPEDRVQLTDGVYTEGYFWTQPSTVGWTNGSPVVITVDLGAVKPVRGVSLNTAAGVAGVAWPESIRVLLADEDRLFHEVGELCRLDAVHGELPRDNYAVHRFWTDALRTHGRYVAFVVTMIPFTFVDEIEVYSGEPEWEKNPLQGEGIGDIKAYLTSLRVRDGVAGRMKNDILSIRALLSETLPESVRADIATSLDSLVIEVDNSSEPLPENFRAVLPLNDLHARILAMQARVWQASGCAPLTVWKSANTWEFLPHIAVPPQDAPASVEVHMMQGEYRAAAFQISNAGESQLTFTLRVEDLPENQEGPCLTVHETAWTDTRELKPVAAALPEAVREGDAWSISAPAGLTRQVWLTFHPETVSPGEYAGRITLASGDVSATVPVTLHVYPLRFPDNPILHCGGWDYVNSGGMYGITPENRQSFIRLLREHFVNAPWATSAVIPAASFENGIYTPGDTAAFDEWLDLWAGAPRYYIFAAVSDHIGPYAIGDPAFPGAVRAWAEFLAAHAVSKSVSPENIYLLLVDEPSDSRQDEVILAWAQALRAAGTGLKVWEDPIHGDMAQANPKMIAACHVLCPNRQMFLQKGQPYQDYYAACQREGIALEFYSCSGPARLLDPYAYYRLQPWLCWKWNAGASHFWAFGDTGNYPSWNEYLGTRAAFSPLFIDHTSVTTAKEMEAIREGIEDYEYLVMLRNAVNEAGSRGLAGEQYDRARELLARAAGQVLDTAGESILWMSDRDRGTADLVRIEILQALSAL